MNETALSAETDEIVDATTFSLPAMIGFILSAIGTLSYQYVQAAPFALMGVCLGVFGLWRASSSKYGMFSRTLAALAVILGTTLASAGLFSRSMLDNTNLTKAKEIADLYLECVSKGEMNKVYFLGGYDPAAIHQSEASDTKQILLKIKTDPVFVEIRNLKNPPKWVFDGVIGEYPQENACTYKLRYINETAPGKPRYEIAIRKNVSRYDIQKKSINWFVDALNLVKPTGP